MRTIIVAALGAFGLSLLTPRVVERTGVRNEDALGGFRELDHLEIERFARFSRRAVLLDQLFGRGEAFDIVAQRDDRALVGQFRHGALVYAVDGELLFERVPRVVLELLVAEAQAAVVFVDFQDNDFDVGTDLREF